MAALKTYRNLGRLTQGSFKPFKLPIEDEFLKFAKIYLQKGKQISHYHENQFSVSLNFIRLPRVFITPSVGENDSKQSDEFQASFR